MIADDDRVAVRNHWTATDAQSGKKLEFRGIVSWRIADRRLTERRAYLEAPHRLTVRMSRGTSGRHALPAAESRLFFPQKVLLTCPNRSE